jgi:hypothetical protein
MGVYILPCRVYKSKYPCVETRSRLGVRASEGKVPTILSLWVWALSITLDHFSHRKRIQYSSAFWNRLEATAEKNPTRPICLESNPGSQAHVLR